MNQPCSARGCLAPASTSALFQAIGSSARSRIHFKLCESHSLLAQKAAMGAI